MKLEVTKRVVEPMGAMNGGVKSYCPQALEMEEGEGGVRC